MALSCVDPYIEVMVFRELRITASVSSISHIRWLPAAVSADPQDLMLAFKSPVMT